MPVQDPFGRSDQMMFLSRSSGINLLTGISFIIYRNGIRTLWQLTVRSPDQVNGCAGIHIRFIDIKRSAVKCGIGNLPVSDIGKRIPDRLQTPMRIQKPGKGRKNDKNIQRRQGNNFFPLAQHVIHKTGLSLFSPGTSGDSPIKGQSPLLFSPGTFRGLSLHWTVPTAVLTGGRPQCPLYRNSPTAVHITKNRLNQAALSGEGGIRTPE